MKPQAIYRKHDSKFAKALDANKNSLQVGDLVRVIDGPNAVRLNNFILPEIFGTFSV